VFGAGNLLDFNINPPVLSTCAVRDISTCSISDPNGNLLFYSDGDTVWTKSHQVMANGTGLFGRSSNWPVHIVSKPASTTLFYIFTWDNSTAAQGFRYSIVDMSLAAGMGSVVTKNSLIHLPPNGQSPDNMTSALHCNGADKWIITQESGNSPILRSYLLTNSGLNLTPVLSTLSETIHTGTRPIVVSPNNKLIAFCLNGAFFQSTTAIAVSDFDNASGAINPNYRKIYGQANGFGLFEFSSDGTKLYAGGQNSLGYNQNIYQWDVCSGDSAVINASRVILTTSLVTSTQGFRQMQLAPNGKIYIGRTHQFAFSEIQYPNLMGVAASLVGVGQPISGPPCYPPNMPNYLYRNAGTVLLNNVQCKNVSFMPPIHTQSACAATQYTPLGYQWNFGDPGSGTSNTSSVVNPTHVYPGAGEYTAQLVISYPCYNDTFRQKVQILSAGPTFSVTGNLTICPGQTSTLSTSGNYTFNWGGQSSGTTYTFKPSTTTNVNVTASDNFGCVASQLVKVTVDKCLDIHGETHFGISVFPNPTSSHLTVLTERTVNLRIISSIGDIEYVGCLSEGENVVDLRTLGLNSGIYFLEIDDIQRSVRKLISKVLYMP
jgi:hypothetical protein